MILENILVFDANYIYKIISKENINDNELIIIILELLNDNLKYANSILDL